MTTYVSLSTYQQPMPRPKYFKVIFILLCFAFPVTIVYVYSLRISNAYEDKIVHEMLNAAAEDPKFADRYLNKDIVPSGLKYILLWPKEYISAFYYLGEGQESFIDNKCAFTNCFVTRNRGLFGGDITKFDAVVFNGRKLKYAVESELPQVRSPHQKYIFANMESSANQPICSPWFDGFFNWTCTYRLNSDIVNTYMDIYLKDKNDKPVGPKVNMEWIANMKEIDDKFKEKLKNKTKAAAWFVSHCKTRSRRENYVELLQKALKPHGLTVDVYGQCGNLICDRSQETICYSKVEFDYYFYLAFENAFSEDYVTEKLLNALNNDAVPIVYGGADYSRFLPPGSYLDAREYDPEALASIMADIITNSTRYHEFFRWRNHYTYSDSEDVEDVCNVCEALNDRSKLMPSVYEEFRSWWNPDWKERCLDPVWTSG